MYLHLCLACIWLSSMVSNNITAMAMILVLYIRWRIGPLPNSSHGQYDPQWDDVLGLHWAVG